MKTIEETFKYKYKDINSNFKRFYIAVSNIKGIFTYFNLDSYPITVNELRKMATFLTETADTIEQDKDYENIIQQNT